MRTGQGVEHVDPQVDELVDAGGGLCLAPVAGVAGQVDAVDAG